MKITDILIAQQAPLPASSPYPAVEEKYGVKIDFKPFYIMAPVASKEFRAQRINISEYTAIVFSAKGAIDSFFEMCKELRVTIPDTMKYFCSTESVAKYLQKHIVYRKRKIFFGNGTAESIVSEVGARHKGEKFLVATSGGTVNDITRAFAAAGLDFTPAMLLKPVSQDIKDVDLSRYQAVVVHNPADVKSLLENFPDFRQGDLRFITFGKTVVKAMEEAGLTIAVSAPSPEVPSIAKAIEVFIESCR